MKKDKIKVSFPSDPEKEKQLQQIADKALEMKKKYPRGVMINFRDPKWFLLQLCDKYSGALFYFPADNFKRLLEAIKEWPYDKKNLPKM